METSDKLNKMTKELGLDRKSLMSATGVKKSTVSTWFSGRSKPSSEYLPFIQELYGCDLKWLLDDKQPWDKTKFGIFGKKGDSLTKPKVADEIAECTAYYDAVAGSLGIHYQTQQNKDLEIVEIPFLIESIENSEDPRPSVKLSQYSKLIFSKIALLKNSVIPSRALSIKIEGNSMEPVLPDGSTVVIDKTKQTIIDGKMYAIDHNGMLRVKIIYRLPGGGLRLRSYNHEEHPDEKYPPEDTKNLKIIGQVIWSAVFY